MKSLMLIGLVISTALPLALSAVFPPVELSPEQEAVRRGVIRVVVEPEPQHHDSLRVYAAGKASKNTRVVARLVVRQDAKKEPALSAPLMVQLRRQADDITGWSIEFSLSPAMAERCDVELYIEDTTGPTDAGSSYLLHVARFWTRGPEAGSGAR